MAKTTFLLNGVDLKQLVGTINAVKQNPELVKFKFRARNEWMNGGHSRTTINGFNGTGGQDISRSKSLFVLEGDEPLVLLGENHAYTSTVIDIIGNKVPTSVEVKA